ncbi:DUF445 family protein [Pyrofollis japonicus]|nr:DUF445 family protein [Pyrofollis japonicus]
MLGLLTSIGIIVLFGLVGGAIGYLTNVIAVRMLFRPEKPRCILPGRRVCIQGLIPARKDALARRLGRVMAKYAYSRSIREKYKQRLEKEIAGLIREAVEEKLRQSPIQSPLAAMLLPGLAEMLAKAVTPMVIELLEKASLRVNVAEIVEEEFKSLPVAELEKVFKEIASKELRFIEIMGFILGAIIGLAEGIIALIV